MYSAELQLLWFHLVPPYSYEPLCVVVEGEFVHPEGDCSLPKKQGLHVSQGKGAAPINQMNYFLSIDVRCQEICLLVLIRTTNISNGCSFAAFCHCLLSVAGCTGIFSSGTSPYRWAVGLE